MQGQVTKDLVCHASMTKPLPELDKAHSLKMKGEGCAYVGLILVSGHQISKMCLVTPKPLLGTTGGGGEPTVRPLVSVVSGGPLEQHL